MMIVVLVVHVLLAISLIGVVLIQKSEGGGLGLGGGGGGGMSGFMTGRSTANLLTRTTAILAGCFMVTSVVLAILAAHQHSGGGSILDQIPASTAPATLPKVPATQEVPAPAQPQQPSVPLAK
ncbi:MAG TPA: preprotein translocase subunit SecG [Aliidongia sp.]|uniref:preprotein translocase subunit SecG n=1 Tax=Aliidongia sp. TaxID=1914230 RepID=UPI002DDD3C28|nr:preprotein translocase subunit SecG [Aliidongia sp.]HEV2678523.1 preprotein translocase subunit SecG [Aliidongia sp.]